MVPNPKNPLAAKQPKKSKKIKNGVQVTLANLRFIIFTEIFCSLLGKNKKNGGALSFEPPVI